MSLWHCYVDESYNGSVFCVGGFLAPEALFDHVGRLWKERLDYENRRSAQKGFPPITRYHATDCAGLKKEFRQEKGWSIPRQILLARRLCEILGEARPIGIVIGARFDEIKEFLSPDEDTARATLYDLCFRMVLVDCSAVIRDVYPGNTINVFYDQSKEFGPLAKRAFQTFREPGTSPEIADCFIDAEPRDSRTCIPLQAADFIAYEGFKRIDGVTKGREELRKSLGALLGLEVPLMIDQFTSETYADLGRMIHNRQNGRPFAEGVTSKLKRHIA
jgi:hypothetical protein